MSVHKVLPESLPARRTGLLRVGLCTLIAALVVVTVIATYYPDSLSYHTKHTMVWVIGVILVVVVVGSYVWGLRDASRDRTLSLEFELTDDRLMQRTPGWPAKEIPLSAIRSLHELQDCLIVVGEEVRITVPSAVTGFAELREKVLGDRRAEPIPGPSAPRIVIAFAPLAAWAVAFFATQTWLTLLAGIVALNLQTFHYYQFVKEEEGGPKRHLATTTAYVLTWLIAFLVVYAKLIHRG